MRRWSSTLLTDKRYWNWNESMEFNSVDWTGCRIVDGKMTMTVMKKKSEQVAISFDTAAS